MTAAIMAVVVAIIVVAAAVVMTGNNNNDLIGTYAFGDGEIVGYSDGEAHWTDEFTADGIELIITSYENNVLVGTWMNMPFEGVYDQGSISFTTMANDVVNMVIGQHVGNAIYLTGLSFDSDEVPINSVKAYNVALAKDGGVASLPDVEVPFENGDSFISTVFDEFIGTSYYSVDSITSTMNVLEVRGGLMLVETTDVFGDAYVSVFAAYSDNCFVGLSYQGGFNIVERSMYVVDDAIVMDSWALDSEIEVATVCIYTEGGVDPELEPIEMDGNVYTDGAHTVGILKVVDNIAFAVMQDAKTHMMLLVWTGEEYNIMTTGTPSIGGFKVFAETIGTVSADYSKMHLTSVAYGEEFTKAYSWDLNLVDDEDSIVGLYLSDVCGTVGTDIEYSIYEIVDSMKSYLLISSYENGIIKGKWWETPFVGTFDGNMLSFFTQYESDGILYTETVFAQLFGNGFILYSTYDDGESVYATIQEYVRAGPDVFDEYGMVKKPVDSDGNTYEAPRFFDGGDTLTSFGGYTFTKDGLEEYSEDTSITMEFASGGLYKMRMTGDSEATMVGFHYIGDVLWLAGVSSELMATYHLNIHDDCLCLGRNVCFDGEYMTKVTRFVAEGMTGEIPGKPVLDGKYIGSKSYSVLTGEKYTDSKESIEMLVHDQNGFVAMLNDITIHAVVCDEVFLITFADRYSGENINCYMDCYGIFSEDGSTLMIYGNGMDQSNGTGYSVVYELDLTA